jgi:adenine-specific DNA-methyltransferase
LTSFAGSGTTAHAVLNLNKVDGGQKIHSIETLDYADTINKLREKLHCYGEGTKEVGGTKVILVSYELGEPVFLEK